MARVVASCSTVLADFPAISSLLHTVVLKGANVQSKRAIAIRRLFKTYGRGDFLKENSHIC